MAMWLTPVSLNNYGTVNRIDIENTLRVCETVCVCCVCVCVVCVYVCVCVCVCVQTGFCEARVSIFQLHTACMCVCVWGIYPPPQTTFSMQYVYVLLPSRLC